MLYDEAQYIWGVKFQGKTSLMIKTFLTIHMSSSNLEKLTFKQKPADNLGPKTQVQECQELSVCLDQGIRS